MGTGRRRRLERDGVIAPLAGRRPASLPAAHVPDGAMKAHDVSCARALVQAVDVLRDQREPRVAPTPGGEHDVRAVRLATGNEMASPAIPLPHERGVACERVGGGQVFWTMAFPETLCTAKRRHTAGGGDPGAGQDGDPRLAPETCEERGKVCRRTHIAIVERGPVYGCSTIPPSPRLRRRRRRSSSGLARPDEAARAYERTLADGVEPGASPHARPAVRHGGVPLVAG